MFISLYINQAQNKKKEKMFAFIIFGEILMFDDFKKKINKVAEK